MSLLTKVGRKSWPAASFLVVTYAILLAGAISMVIPFMTMLTSSVSNEWDYEKFHAWPVYLIDRQERYMKFLTEKYLDIQGADGRIDRDFRIFAAAYQPKPWHLSFRVMREDEDFHDESPFLFGSEATRGKELALIRQDYLAWMAQYDHPLQTLPMFARFVRIAYQDHMRDLYTRRYLDENNLEADHLTTEALESGALALMAETWDEARFKHFFFVEMGNEGSYPYHLRIWMPPLNQKRLQDYLHFVDQLPGDWKVPITVRQLWLRHLDNAAGSLDAFREETGLAVDSYAEVPYPDSRPDNPRLAELWDTFLHDKWPLWMIELPADMAGDYRDYLQRRTGDLDRFNRMVNAAYTSWREVPFDGRPPVSPLERNFWRDYLAQLSDDLLIANRSYPELDYRRFLQERYGDVAALNSAYGWNAASFQQVEIPLAEVDYAQFLETEGWWLRQFLTFNFRRVFTYMAIQGRAVWNTLILVVLSLIACLTVNPLAAYALSRFQMKSSQKILLFLLATMAFPHEVAMIPNFLLLRELGMLNTFSALVLPGLANGFGIFLLKGFFDSLPSELYEAATIDGANEITIFTRISLPLCKPILAYQALLTFIAAYGGFMWAFLVCQDQHMWTLMVWIYQYQQAAGSYPYMVMAAFVLASIPTLIVFLFCQKIILRGIIIPTMK